MKCAICNIFDPSYERECVHAHAHKDECGDKLSEKSKVQKVDEKKTSSSIFNLCSMILSPK